MGKSGTTSPPWVVLPLPVVRPVTRELFINTNFYTVTLYLSLPSPLSPLRTCQESKTTYAPGSVRSFFGPFPSVFGTETPDVRPSVGRRVFLREEELPDDTLSPPSLVDPLLSSAPSRGVVSPSSTLWVVRDV